jgi:hypothetical protein
MLLAQLGELQHHRYLGPQRRRRSPVQADAGAGQRLAVAAVGGLTMPAATAAARMDLNSPRSTAAATLWIIPLQPRGARP